MEAVILAGGLGTRLRSVVAELPKPMAPVHGRPFLEYQLKYWRRQGLTRAVLSVGYMARTIIAHFGRSFLDIELDYAVEPEPLGTGGGLLLAAGQVREERFLLLNGDTYFEMDYSRLDAFHRAHRAELTLSLARVAPNARYGGVNLDADGRVLGFRAQAETTGESILINAGAYLVDKRLLSAVAPPRGVRLSLETELLGRWIGAGHDLFGVVGDGCFIDIGVPEDYAAASGVLAAAG